MSLAATDSPTRSPAICGGDDVADHSDRRREREPKRSWIWTLVESLPYVGAAFDPATALAAQRLARIRDEELQERPVTKFSRKVKQTPAE